MTLTNVLYVGRFVNPKTERMVNIYKGTEKRAGWTHHFYLLRMKRVWVGEEFRKWDVACHVCNGSKKSPLGNWECQCCKGRGQLTAQEHRIKTTVMRDFAAALAKKSNGIESV